MNKTIITVTHDPHAASFATYEQHLEKGVLTESKTNTQIPQIASV